MYRFYGRENSPVTILKSVLKNRKHAPADMVLLDFSLVLRKYRFKYQLNLDKFSIPEQWESLSMDFYYFLLANDLLQTFLEDPVYQEVWNETLQAVPYLDIAFKK